jgi:biotin carboxyl carrier protein
MKWLVKLADSEHQVEIEEPDGEGGIGVTVDGRPMAADVADADQGGLTLIISGESFTVDFDRRGKGSAVLLGHTEQNFFPVSVTDERQVRSNAGGSPRLPEGLVSVLAPMPGKVVRLLAKVGDEVKADQGLVIVEAMKMENELKAPRGGRVAEILVREGAAVEGGQKLCVLE